MTTIRKIVTSKIDGDNANNTSTSEVRPFGELAVYVDTDNNDGPDKLELLMFDGARTHLRSKVLAKGTFYGGDADSGSQGDGIENFDTIKLIPDAELHYNDSDYGNDQYIVIDPTFPNHIHVRAGGAIDSSTAILFLGGELNNVSVSDAADQVAISTNSTHTWLFDLDGSLTVPDAGIKGGPGGVNKVDLSWELILTSGKTIKINPGVEDVYSPTFFGFNSDGSGGGIALPAGSSFDDRLTGVLISGAGLLEVNRFYPKVSNTLYEAVDAGVTYRLIDQSGTWSLDIVGANNPQYTSADLVTWANAGGGLPAPTGELTTRETTLTVGTNTWTFGEDGKLTAPGNLQVDGGKIILNTGGNAYLESVDYGVNSANSAVNIFGGPYQKIKLRAGYGGATWTFGTDGRLINQEGLILTAGGQFNICTIVTSGSGYNTGNALKATTGGSGTGMTVGIGYGLSNQLSNVDVVDPGTGYVDGDVITVSEGTGGTFVLTRYNNQANQGNNNTVEFNWTFGTNGRLTLPGALVKSTVAKTGAINPGIDKVATVSIEPTYDATWNASYSVSVGGFSCDINFPSAGNPEFVNIVDTVGNRTVGATLATVLGSALGTTGVNGVNDMVIKVATLTTTIATAIDLTKSVNKLSNGDYTLANGVEGQIMYLVRQTAATGATVTVANARPEDVIYTNTPFLPFTDGADPTNMATLIFTDGAWQAMGGYWSFT